MNEMPEELAEYIGLMLVILAGLIMAEVLF